MAQYEKITIPARTSKTIRVSIVSGLTDLETYQFDLTVKKSVKLPAIVFVVIGYLDSTEILFDISSTDTDITPGTYKFDIIADNGSRRVPICEGDLVIDLWPSSITV